ncbi:MAG: alpha/beta fold hydrolase [Terriglobia bacterium]
MTTGRTDFICLIAALGILLALELASRHLAKDLEIIETALPNAPRTPIVIIQKRPGANAPNQPGAGANVKLLLIHGLSASKSTMMQMGMALAQSGAECYLIDLPGHGASTGKFSWPAGLDAVAAASRWILAERNPDSIGSSRHGFFLIGHSLGGGIVIKSAQLNSQVTGVVALSPTAVPVTLNSPNHMLILVGENDFPFVKRSAAFLFESTTSQTIHPSSSITRWENQEKTQRLVFLPLTEHSGSLFQAKVYGEIEHWINQTLQPSAIGLRPSVASGKQVVINGLLCLSALMSWFPAFSLLAKWKPTNTDQRVESGSAPWHGNAIGTHCLTGFQIYRAYALFSFLALLILRWHDPWNYLHLMGGGFLTGFLSLTGLFLFLWRRPSRKIMRFNIMPLLTAVAGVVLLLLYPFPLLTQHFVFLQCTPIRSWNFLLIAISLMPFFVWEEWIFRQGLALPGNWQRAVHFVSTRLILAFTLMIGFLFLNNSQFLILLLLPGLALLSLLVWLGSGWVFFKTGSSVASALFGSLLTGLIFSAFFTRV